MTLPADNASPNGSPNVSRGVFGSRMGFILAAAGSAIGLGNIWRFPYMAAEGGGGIFVLVYLGFAAFIGVPVLLAELSIGRATRGNPVSAFKRLFPGSWWPVLGGLGVLTGFAILAFYSVVAGWTLSYLGRAMVGRFGDPITAEQSGALFEAIIADPLETVAMTAVFLGMTALVVRGGIGGGIERASKILMPIFFVLLLVLALRSLTLPGAGKGIEFFLSPDLGELTPASLMSGLGQALFSLSLGMGAMITYGSYVSKQENLGVAAGSVALFDTAVALLGGLVIFPALSATGTEGTAGPGLVFVVLPTIFDQMPAGGIFAVAFYALLGIAALTSTIGLLEVVVAYFVDDRGWSRERAVWTITIACLVLAVPSALSQGASPALGDIAGRGFLDWQSTIFGNYALSIGALLIAVFVGWKWGVRNALAEMPELPAKIVWAVLIKYVCPIAVSIVLGFILFGGGSF